MIPCIIDVPFIFIVAPRDKANEEIFFETPILSDALIETCNDAFDYAVENATLATGQNFCQNFFTLRPVKIFSMKP